MNIPMGTIVKAFEGDDYEIMHDLDREQVDEIKTFISSNDPGEAILIGIDWDGDSITLPLDYFECVEALLSYVETDPPQSLSLFLNNNECEIVK